MSTVLRRERTLTSSSRAVLGLLLLAAACGDGSDGSPTEPGETDASTQVKADAGNGGGQTEQDGGAVDDDDAGEAVDAGQAETDAGEPDASEPDAGEPDAGEPEPRETVQVLQISQTGHDRLYGVTHDAEGNLYATGQLAGDIASTADYALLLVKLTPAGELDSRFANGGVAVKNVAVGGAAAEVARGVVVQSTGKIVIAGTAEHDPRAAGVLARDTDIVLVRFNVDGTVDTTFGTDGVVRLDLGTGLETQGTNGATLSGADSQWSLSLAANDGLVVHGTTRASGNKTDGSPRTDTDWALVKLSAEGVRDAAFGSDGLVTLDIAEANASARSATVLADGSIIGTGYATTTALGASTQQPVLYKVTPTGAFDAAFAADDATGTPGVFYDYVTTVDKRAEAYGAAPQGANFITLGYGPTIGAGTGSDWIFARFTGAGAHDLTFGAAATPGLSYVDIGGYADNGRAVVVLPDQRILGIGGGRPAPATAPAQGTTPPADAVLVMLDKDGAADTSFDTDGVQTFDFGGTGDFFWAGEVAPDGKSVAIVGIAGAATAANDDDGVVVIVKLD